MTARHPVLLTTPNLTFVEPVLATRYDVIRAWENPDRSALSAVRALICLGHQSPAEFLDRLPSLGLLACFTTGYDGIDLDEMQRRGVLVSHAPGATAYAVAEFALTQILVMFRNVMPGERLVRSGSWTAESVTPIGRSMKNARIGIVGLGAIGRSLAEMAHGLGAAVSWWAPRTKSDVPWPYVDTLIQLAEQSDVLAVCARADLTNQGLISADVLAALGADGILVNVARGQLVDEDALIIALRERVLGGAALDVFETEPTPASRWDDVPNILLTPHIGGASTTSTTRMTTMVMDNLSSFFAGQGVVNPVRFEHQSTSDVGVEA